MGDKSRRVDIGDEDVYAVRLALFTAYQKHLRSANNTSLAGDKRRYYRKLAEQTKRVLDDVENPRRRAKVKMKVVQQVTRVT